VLAKILKVNYAPDLIFNNEEDNFTLLAMNDEFLNAIIAISNNQIPEIVNKLSKLQAFDSCSIDEISGILISIICLCKDVNKQNNWLLYTPDRPYCKAVMLLPYDRKRILMKKMEKL